jgi:hypothetical protein
MKKPILFLWFLLAASYTHAGGYFNFDNFSGSPNAPTWAPAVVTIGPNGAAGEGAAGAYVGSDYTASAFYLPGNFLDQATFDSLNPIYFSSADSVFLGTTGNGPSDPDHNPYIDGAGLFFANDIVTLPVTGTVTVQIRVWYNGGGLYTTYDQAVAAGVNLGESNPVLVKLALIPQVPPNLDGLQPFEAGSLQPFQVGPAPEPTTFALCGLGTAAFLLIRRRK